MRKKEKSWSAPLGKLSDDEAEIPVKGFSAAKSPAGVFRASAKRTVPVFTGMPTGSWKIKEDHDQTRESSDSVPKAVDEDKANRVVRKRFKANKARNLGSNCRNTGETVIGNGEFHPKRRDVTAKLKQSHRDEIQTQVSFTGQQWPVKNCIRKARKQV